MFSFKIKVAFNLFFLVIEQNNYRNINYIKLILTRCRDYRLSDYFYYESNCIVYHLKKFISKFKIFIIMVTEADFFFSSGENLNKYATFPRNLVKSCVSHHDINSK